MGFPSQVYEPSAAGAFAHAAPNGDVYLSPDQAVFARGVLIPVKYLVNGTTIAQMRVDRVEHWDVELPHHAVLLADAACGEPCCPAIAADCPIAMA